MSRNKHKTSAPRNYDFSTRFQNGLQKKIDDALRNTKHYDRPDLFPDMTVVRINIATLEKRPVAYLPQGIIEWAKNTIDKEMKLILYRESKDNGTVRVMIEEDAHGVITFTKNNFVFDLFSELYVWNKDKGLFEEPIKVLEELQKASTEPNNKEVDKKGENK